MVHARAGETPRRRAGRLWVAVSLALLVTTTPSAGRAQSVLYVFMGGGPSYPVGPLAHTLTSDGYDVIVGALVRRLLSHVGLRVAGTFAEFPADRPARGYLRFAGLVTNVSGELDAPVVHPYGFLGFGYYYYASTVRLTVPPAGGETPPPRLPPHGYTSAIGLDGGVGVRIPLHRFSVIVEGRDDYLLLGRRDATAIPLTAGVSYTYSLRM